MTDNELVALYTELIPHVVKTYCKKNKLHLQKYDFEDVVGDLFIICQEPRFDKYNFKTDGLLIFADIYLQIPKVLKKLFKNNEVKIYDNEDNFFYTNVHLKTEFDNKLLDMYFNGNYTVAEIARIKEISKDKVYRVLRIYSRKLEKELHDYTH